MSDENHQDRELGALLRRAAPFVATDACVDAEPFDLGRIDAFRRGRLPEAGAEVVAAHLAECPHCRGLLEGLAEPLPAALKERMRSAATPRTRSRTPWIGAGVALAAALALMVVRPWDAGLAGAPEAELVAVEGALKAVRAANSTGDVFIPRNQVRVIVRPSSAGEALVARAFVARDDKLSPLPASALTRAPSGAFIVEGRAGDLFGEPPADLAVYVGIARDAASLDAVGPELEKAKQSVAIRWVVAPIQYRSAGP